MDYGDDISGLVSKFAHFYAHFRLQLAIATVLEMEICGENGLLVVVIIILVLSCFQQTIKPSTMLLAGDCLHTFNINKAMC